MNEYMMIMMMMMMMMMMMAPQHSAQQQTALSRANGKYERCHVDSSARSRTQACLNIIIFDRF